MVGLVLGIYLILGLSDPYRRFKSGKRNDFYACAILYAAGFVLALFMALDIPIPSPSVPLQKLVKLVIHRSG